MSASELYTTSETNLKLLVCHDSCWRFDGVHKWLRENEESITNLFSVETEDLSEDMYYLYNELEHAKRF